MNYKKNKVKGAPCKCSMEIGKCKSESTPQVQSGFSTTRKVHQKLHVKQGHVISDPNLELGARWVSAPRKRFTHLPFGCFVGFLKYVRRIFCTV